MPFTVARQLAFDLPHAESFRRDDFLPDASNEAALALVDSWPDWPNRVAAIVGPPGSGKSHLAAIWAERAGARIADAGALSLTEVPRTLVTGALALENLAPGRVDEPAIFHLLNLAREEDAFLLITAESRQHLQGHATADLASRLRAVPVFELSAAGERLLGAVLVKLFADRQLSIEEDTIAYLLARMERSLAAARDLVARLDSAALSRGRRITRQLAADVLREQESQE